jgi:hypothetical protein
MMLMLGCGKSGKSGSTSKLLQRGEAKCRIECHAEPPLPPSTDARGGCSCIPSFTMHAADNALLAYTKPGTL